MFLLNESELNVVLLLRCEVVRMLTLLLARHMWQKWALPLRMSTVPYRVLSPQKRFVFLSQPDVIQKMTYFGKYIYLSVLLTCNLFKQTLR